jgi:putative intracellular protease/amidase
MEIDNIKKLLAAICFGPMHLASAGILKEHKYTTTALPELLSGMNIEDPFINCEGYIEQPVVKDTNIITATANAFIDFAFEVVDSPGLLSDKAEKDELTRLYKNSG